MKWVIGILIVLLYVNLFNAIAPLYFDSGSTLTLKDLWRRIVPARTITFEL